METNFTRLSNDAIDELESDRDALLVFVYLSRRATYLTARPVEFGGRKIMLAVGQWATRVSVLSHHLKLTTKVVRRCLASLAKRSLITTTTTVDCHHTLVTVLDLASGQRVGQGVGRAEGKGSEVVKAAPAVPFTDSDIGEEIESWQGSGQRGGQQSKDWISEDGRSEELTTPPARTRVDQNEFPSISWDGQAAEGIRELIEQISGCRMIEGRDFNREAWAEELRLLRHERDKYPVDIDPLIVFAFKDGHWRRQVRSAAEFRRNFLKIAIDHRNPKPKFGKLQSVGGWRK